MVVPQEERPVLEIESKSALPVPTVLPPIPTALPNPSHSSGKKRIKVSEEDHNHLQHKYKKLKKSNTYNLEEARKERAEMSSTTIGLEKKYEDAKKEEMEATLKLRVKTFELTTTEGNLEEKKKENIILKEENKELKHENTKLKQDLQRTKEEMSRWETEKRMFQFIQQQQQQQQPRAPAICAIM